MGVRTSLEIHQDLARPRGKRRAIVIGVSDYDDKNLQALEFCRNDAAKMLEVLEKLGYEIADNHKLTGYVKYDIMREAIYDFFDNKKSGAEDTLLFYYSGHGIPTSSGSTVLASSQIDHDDPRRKGFSSYELTELIQNSVAIRIVEILDCCYSGSAKVGKGFEELGKGKGAEDAAATLGTVAIEKNARMLREQGEGKCLLAASQAAQEAYGLKEKGHSIFTYYLLEGLNQNRRSIDSNGAVTPYTLGNYVYREIMNLPQNKRPKQKPIIKTEAAGDIILAYYPDLVNRPGPPEHSIEEFWINRGLQYFENGDYTNAIDSFDKVLEINPKNQQAYNYKGDVFFRLERYEEAITCYDMALEINPKYLDVLKDKGLALEKLGRDDEAMECYDEALRIRPDYHDAVDAKKRLLHKKSNPYPLEPPQGGARRTTRPRFASILRPKYSRWKDPDLAGIAIDSSGNVYVAKKKHNQIEKLDNKGNLVLSLECPHPHGITIGPSGHVYTTARTARGYCIKKFHSNGQLDENWGQIGNFKDPEGVAVDSSGNVYVADTGSHLIWKFDSEGNPLLTWGGRSKGDIQFDHLGGIAIDVSNSVYVTDVARHNVQKFDSEGNFILSWGRKGERDGQFKNPKGIVTDSDGNVYVCDEDNHRIQKFDSEGNFILSWGSKGKKSPGQFNSPFCIAVDSAGSVYVGDRDYSIQKFVYLK